MYWRYASVEPAIALLPAEGIALTGFGVGQPSLDEVFLALTGHTAEDQNDDEQAGDLQEERAA